MATYRIEQNYKYKGEDYWDWSAWIEGSRGDIDKIKEVKWILHPTFPNPIRVISDKASKFKLETGGWGVFNLKATILLGNGEEVKLTKEIELYYPDGSQNLA